MESRYAALAREIARDIAWGKHPVGSLLPGEIELTERHGVSRSTVRSALQQLQDLGLISRHKRIGTRVKATRPQTDYAPTLATLEDLIHFAAEAERRVRAIEEIVADDELAARLGCRPGSGGCSSPPLAAIRISPNGRSPGRASTLILPMAKLSSGKCAEAPSSSRPSSSRNMVSTSPRWIRRSARSPSRSGSPACSSASPRRQHLKSPGTIATQPAGPSRSRSVFTPPSASATSSSCVGALMEAQPPADGH